jgi:hypothetical protein
MRIRLTYLTTVVFLMGVPGGYSSGQAENGKAASQKEVAPPTIIKREEMSPEEKVVRDADGRFLRCHTAMLEQTAASRGVPYKPQDLMIFGIGKIQTGLVQQVQAQSPACAPCDCTCSTPVSDTEWSDLHYLFPNMERCRTCKLGPATSTYNCLAYTIDDTTRWWWPEADGNGDGTITVAEMTAFYQSKGKSNIAFFGTSTSDVRHVAKKSGGNGNGCLARSKCGQLLLLSHDLNQMEGGPSYGNIVGGN